MFLTIKERVMRILVLGSSQESWLGVALQASDAEISFGSRSTGCDVRNAKQVEHMVEGFRPNAIVLAASTFPEPATIGNITDWATTSALLAAKTVGMLASLDAAVRYGVNSIIVLGGAAVSGHSGMAHFTVANGALWSAVQFVTRHTTLRAYYLELGVVLPSPVGEQYLSTLSTEQQEAVRKLAISPAIVAAKIHDLLGPNAPEPGSRISLLSTNP